MADFQTSMQQAQAQMQEREVQITKPVVDSIKLTIKELAERIAKILDFDLDPIYVPGRPQEVNHANCSSDKARKLLGYSTKTTLDEGLQELVQWIKQKGAKEFDYHLPLEFITEKTPKTWTDRLM